MDMPVKIYVASRIRMFRETSGLSFEYIANEIGMSLADYLAIEQGELTPSLEFIGAFCELLDLSTESIYPLVDKSDTSGSCGNRNDALLAELCTKFLSLSNAQQIKVFEYINRLASEE